jgi:hypothetical protein
LYTKLFSNEFRALTQQTDSRLSPLCSFQNGQGEEAVACDQVQSFEAVPMTGRFASMPRVDPSYDRRWAFPQAWQLPLLLSEMDLRKMVVSPQGELMRGSVAAMMRRKDAIIAAALFADSATGKTATTTTTALPSAQKVAITVGGTGNVGMNFAKLRRAKRILLGNDVDVETEQIDCVLTAIQHDELMTEIQVGSKEYNEARDGRPVYAEGRLERFYGINFHIYNQLPVDASSDRLIPVFVRGKAMRVVTWLDITTSVSRRNDLEDEPWQLYVKQMHGATRLEEKLMVQITCNE